MKLSQHRMGRGILLLLLTIALPLAAQHSPPDQSLTPPSFIQDSLVRSYALVNTSKQAMEHSSSQEVKGYAQRMNDEYTNIIGKLHDLAKQKELPIQKDELSNVADNLTLAVDEPQQFDVAYGKNQVPAIEQLMNLFQQAVGLQDQDVSRFAAQHLPYIQRHLQMAEQLFATTTETRTDIYQSRENQLDQQGNEANQRVPTTERLNP
jgi:predicted outer membrane protein